MCHIEAERFSCKLEAKRNFQVINVADQYLINAAAVIYSGDKTNLNLGFGWNNTSPWFKPGRYPLRIDYFLPCKLCGQVPVILEDDALLMVNINPLLDASIYLAKVDLVPIQAHAWLLHFSHYLEEERAVTVLRNYLEVLLYCLLSDDIECYKKVASGVGMDDLRGSIQTDGVSFFCKYSFLGIFTLMTEGLQIYLARDRAGVFNVDSEFVGRVDFH